MKTKTKTTLDLNSKHFSRYGEFLVSFELSKHGWNVYDPVYDEYIDLIIHKHVCADCGEKWAMTPLLVCKKCGKDFSKTQKHNIIPIKICAACKNRMSGNVMRCAKCKGEKLINLPTCDKCNGEVEMVEHKCACGSKKYTAKFRSIQVKSSRVESEKKSYAVDMKPRDLIKDKSHFYIWCLVDNRDKNHFLVLSVDNYIQTMGNSLKGTSFFKDQDRQHFSAKDFGKWKKFENCFEKLE